MEYDNRVTSTDTNFNQLMNLHNPVNNAKRESWVDVAKGIGIILVVLGHNKCPLGKEIFAFHMPLFFILSGFFLKNDGFGVFLYKKLRTLLVPCFFFWVLFFFLSTPILYLRDQNLFWERFSDKTLFSFTTLDPSLWFLVALWWSLLLSFIIVYVIKPLGRICQIIIAFTCFVLGYYVSAHGSYNLYITHGFIAIPFVLLGRTFYRHKYIFVNKILWMLLAISLLSFIVSLNYWDPIVNLSILDLPSNPMVYLIPAISGSFVIISISMFMYHKNVVQIVLSNLGEMSLFIMALHGGFGPIVRPLRNYLHNDWFYSLLVSSIELILSYYVGMLLIRKIPSLFGYKKK